jgi:hypothetical protein
MAAALFMLPADAAAQRRGAVAQQRGAVRVGAVRVGSVRPRAAVVVSAYAFRPFYYGPYFYDSLYYAPYAQWYPPYGARYDASSSLRVQVTPRETEVFVDGYFAGRVDDFDGWLQRLHLEPGEHEVQLYLPGHRTFSQKLYLQPTTLSRIRHEMVPLGPGDAPSVRPTGGPLPERREAEDDSPRRAPGPDRDREPRGPQPRARAAETGFGSLALRVQPGDAEVLIDGEKWQGTPDDRLVVQLGGGVHNIELRKEGYRTYMTDVTVRPGETATLNVAMTRVDK